MLCWSTYKWVINTRNDYVVQVQGIDTQWSHVEVQYQRRFDLIPNIVASVKGYLEHEQKVFSDIAEARTKYAGAPAGTPAKLEAMTGLEGALGRLLVVIEKYPDLKAQESVQKLMAELSGTENQIASYRRQYNELVKQYNISIDIFPDLIIAKIFDYDARKLYEADGAASKAPVVDLTTD